MVPPRQFGADAEVVDENGKGFEPYVYPDATIDETELWVGDTSLHMSLTGDARFFEYAAQGQITINVALAQYPADEDFVLRAAIRSRLAARSA